MYCKKCGSLMSVNETEVEEIDNGTFVVNVYYDCIECDKTFFYSADAQVEYVEEVI